MSTVTIYTRPFCGYCARALGLLRERRIAFTEIETGFDPAKRQEMLAKSGGASTFPQIFIGEDHIGGCDDLLALEAAGELDRRLAR